MDQVNRVLLTWVGQLLDDSVCRRVIALVTYRPERLPNRPPYRNFASWLSGQMARFKVRARLFHNGPLCGISRFPAEPGCGFLYVSG